MILYALLAVLLWPADRDPAAPFVWGLAVGRGIARGLWLVLWASLAFFAVQPASRAPKAISGMLISDMAAGQPGWLAWTDNHAASARGGQGLTASSCSRPRWPWWPPLPFLPSRLSRAALVLAIVLAVLIWIAEGLGGMFTGGGTDPNSGPAPRPARAGLLARRAEPWALPPRGRSVTWGRSGLARRRLRRRDDHRGRLLHEPPGRRALVALVIYVDSDGVQMVMGVAMAGMLVTGLRFLSAGIWEAVFAAAAAWFAWRFIRMRGGAPPSLWRSPQPGPYLVECGAMLYMYLALPAVAVAAKGAAGGISATGTRFSFLALVLALFILGYVAWVGDRFPAPAVALKNRTGAAPATGLPEESGARMSATVPESAGAASHGGGAGACTGRVHTWPLGAPRCARSPWASPWATS